MDVKKRLQKRVTIFQWIGGILISAYGIFLAIRDYNTILAHQEYSAPGYLALLELGFCITAAELFVEILQICKSKSF